MVFSGVSDNFKNDLAKTELKIMNKSVLSEPVCFLGVRKRSFTGVYIARTAESRALTT